MDFFPLHIFPTGILSNSIFISVWVGAIIVVTMNLRFGWPVSGLVVPGYLVPIILDRPLLAAAIVFNSMVTYYFVYLVSKVAGRFKNWHSFFGRDYFFLIIIFSIFVRTGFDKFFYPVVGEFVNQQFHLNFDYRNNLHSFGIVVIALLAHSFWNTSFKRAVIPLIVNLFLTILVVRFVIMVFTNYSLSSFSHLYTDVALYLDATPKTYLMLLIAAYVASYYNLFYAWGYNGILIPALLALNWYDPTRILISLLEAGLIYLFAKVLTHYRLLKQSYFEGGKRMILFFTLSLVYKVISTYFFGYWLQYKMTDFLGFGYLLTTLIAIRMYDKDPFLRIFRSMIQLLVVAIVVSTLIGFSFTLIPRRVDTITGQEWSAKQVKLESIQQKWLQYVQGYYPSLYEGLLRPMPVVTGKDQKHLLRAFDFLERFSETRNRYFLIKANEEAGLVSYHVQEINQRYLSLVPALEAKEMGEYFIDITAKNKKALILSDKKEVTTLFLPAAFLMQQAGAHYYLVAPTESNAPIRFRDYLYSKNVFSAIRKKIPKSQQTEIVIQQPEQGVDKNVLYLSSSKINEILNSYFFTFTVSINHTPSLMEYLNQRKELLPTDAGSLQYRSPTAGQLFYMDLKVIKPLLELLQAQNHLNENQRAQRFKAINTYAEALGYQLVIVKNKFNKKSHLVLQKNLKLDNNNFWGTYVFSFNWANNYIIEVPRAYYELNTFHVGAELYQKTGAFALLISDTHPYVNLEGRSDVVALQNLKTLFTLVHQVLLRETPSHYLIMQLRGFSKSEGQKLPPADAVITLRTGLTRYSELNEQKRKVVDAMKSMGYKVIVAQGEADTAGLTTSLPAQLKYLRVSNRDEMMEIWLSPILRASLRKDINNPLLLRQLAAAGIPAIKTNILTWFSKQMEKETLSCAQELPERMRYQLNQYNQKRNLVLLTELIRAWPNYTFSSLHDSSAGYAYLLVKLDGKLLAVLKLKSRRGKISFFLSCEYPLMSTVQKFIQSDAIWLYVK